MAKVYFSLMAANYQSLTESILQTLFSRIHSIPVNTHTCTEAYSYPPLVRVQILSDEQASATVSAEILLSDLSTKIVRPIHQESAGTSQKEVEKHSQQRFTVHRSSCYKPS
jgi:hypothetical protein